MCQWLVHLLAYMCQWLVYLLADVPVVSVPTDLYVPVVSVRTGLYVSVVNVLATHTCQSCSPFFLGYDAASLGDWPPKFPKGILP
jgi:hypothetical protein